MPPAIRKKKPAAPAGSNLDKPVDVDFKWMAWHKGLNEISGSLVLHYRRPVTREQLRKWIAAARAVADEMERAL